LQAQRKLTVPKDPKEGAAMFRVCILGLAALSMMSFPMIVHAELGICCFEDGSCIMIEEEDCTEIGGCAFFPGAE
jgi:hypothetical protein